MPEYTIQRLRGELALVTYDNAGKRHRYTLGTSDPREAERIATSLLAEITRPKTTIISELWKAYDRAKAGRVIIERRVYSWKALAARFGATPAEDITLEDCKAHIAERRRAGVKDGTIYTELSHLRTTVSWAVKSKLLARAPWIERPSQPKPREEFLTKKQCSRLIKAAKVPHVKLYLILILGTGARNAALLGLKWQRVDFKRGLIDLRDPDITIPHKGRAIVPMNDSVREALLEAQKTARCDYVIEWGGERVASVKRGINTAAKKAKVGHVWPHLFRHSAGVHMAEDSIPMEEIQQYFGHKDIETTRKFYARYSPEYLREAAKALEY